MRLQRFVRSLGASMSSANAERDRPSALQGRVIPTLQSTAILVCLALGPDDHRGSGSGIGIIAGHEWHAIDDRRGFMMHHDARYMDTEPASRHWPKVALGVLGGLLYVLAALAIMQVAFLFWIGMW